MMRARELAAHQRALYAPEDGPLFDTAVQPAAERILAAVEARRAHLEAALDRKEVAPPERSTAALASSAALRAHASGRPTLHSLAEGVALYCGPLAASLHAPGSRYDRNRCAWLPTETPVWVYPERVAGVRLMVAPTVLGFASAATPLKLSEALEPGRLHPVPASAEAAASREHAVPWSRELRPMGLQRAALMRRAFALMGRPYVWGGDAGGYDCSSFLQAVFASAGVALPRNSAEQLAAAPAQVPLAPELPAARRLALLDALHAHGVLLLYLPGHIMLYLGRDSAGVPRVIHALGEAAQACPGAPQQERILDVARVMVSGLEVGEGSLRGSLLSRLSAVAYWGPATPTLRGVLVPRPLPVEEDVVRPCDKTPKRDWWVSGGEGRSTVMVTGQLPLSFRVAAQTRQGVLYRPIKRLGLVPEVALAELPVAPEELRALAIARSGRWESCQRLRVSRAERADSSDEAPKTRRWRPSEEAFFSAFVEQLFSGDAQATWPELTPLLRDPARNVFAAADARRGGLKRMRPDCADLPYFLRAYYAFQRALPFRYQRCGRGRRGHPPHCGPATTWRPGEAARPFRETLRDIASQVHSGALRADPRREDTDTYPVALKLRNLRPGTVYADPYGHVLIVARWEPATLGAPARLMGADGQPDGTLGLRHFWPGSFLFDPDFVEVGAGAGFRAWRPLAADAEAPTPTNAALPAYSLAQYGLDREAYHDQVRRLAEPWPADPSALVLAYVEAFHETVRRRVQAVANAERWHAAHPAQQITMPEGYRIFETTGPWEDFASPARDLRLLISLDAVMALPTQRATQADDEAALRAKVSQELIQRQISYARQDGSSWTLSLAEVVAREEALLQAFNPNDCPALRWGAPADSDERSACTRRAPEAQRRRMRDYLPFFRARRRPPRRWSAAGSPH